MGRVRRMGLTHTEWAGPTHGQGPSHMKGADPRHKEWAGPEGHESTLSNGQGPTHKYKTHAQGPRHYEHPTVSGMRPQAV